MSAAAPPASFGSLDGSISVRMPGAAAPKPVSAPDAPVDPSAVARSGALTTTAGGSKKVRWVVFGGGQLAVYGDKKVRQP